MVIGLLREKVALVTGGSRGIGRAIAVASAEQGARVVVNYNREEELAHRVVDEIEELGGEAVKIQADVSSMEDIKAMVEETIDIFGSLEILFNNAGVLLDGGSLLDMDIEQFEPMWKVNVNGVINCSRASAPTMISSKYGKIVNIASVAGLGTSILPGNYLYAATKAAVIIITKRLALELGKFSINVNAIAPGLIRTDMGLREEPEGEQEGRLNYFREHSILGRIGEPMDIADVAIFLASDKSRFITGQTITVDGGRTDFITHSL
jgi:3-oxoacyl-[acyl-carrier protein] reductase